MKVTISVMKVKVISRRVVVNIIDLCDFPQRILIVSFIISLTFDIFLVITTFSLPVKVSFYHLYFFIREGRNLIGVDVATAESLLFFANRQGNSC